MIMEIGAELSSADATLEASWVPRTHNVEADALSNGVCDAFSPERRVRLRPGDLRWRVLDRLLEQLPQMREQASEARSRQAQQRRQPRRSGKRVSLRERDPW